MRKVCLVCERTAPDGNLLCHEVYCPAETSPLLLDPGERLGEIEIVRLLVVLRSAALYEVRQGQRSVLLKVAHPGAEHTDRLKREAKFLNDPAVRQEREPGLPRVLPPYLMTGGQAYPYGRATIQGRLLYYCVFEQFDGVPLRDLMFERPQLGVYEVGWLLMGLARTLDYLQQKGLYHYGLSPESVLVRFDKRGAPRPLLWDLGIAGTRNEVERHWYRGFLHPAYTAPELIDAQRPAASLATDVYGLGLILYELLNGAPAYPYRLRSDQEIFDAVRKVDRLSSDRVDVRKIAALADRAISKDPTARPTSARALRDELRAEVGEPPAAGPNLEVSPRTALIVTLALLGLALLILLGYTASELPRIFAAP